VMYIRTGRDCYCIVCMRYSLLDTQIQKYTFKS